jgi:hypothetical protein
LGVVQIGGAQVARLGRPGGLSEAGKMELWERWKAGESISDISRALKKPPGSIHGMLEAPRAGSPRPTGADRGWRSLRTSGRKSPAGSPPENPCAPSLLAWDGLPLPYAGR